MFLFISGKFLSFPVITESPTRWTLLPPTTPILHSTGKVSARYFLLAVIQRIGEQKLLRKYKINGKVLEGLIDTGADISVISSNCWDPTWPLESASAVWGVGGPQTSSKSVQWLPVSLPDSSETIAYIQPCVLKIHLNLWGRDLLQQLQATIQFNE
ncbi:endogenous retrovirus group K member 10 Pro protein-like [Podarcis lilfordi]|uniref:Endogenous retrovirus group K member 10 Pro protein-like n=1 Tax=Podarcis lilfordi TaxID=74358 RepID=A0AA35LNU7_9SAUR|nr:endogenous retrovirus group K member 10 Pro protein-like [Podarcis lilfordi]